MIDRTVFYDSIREGCCGAYKEAGNDDVLCLFLFFSYPMFFRGLMGDGGGLHQLEIIF